MSNLYPLTFTPALKDYIWGGRNLETRFGRKLPPEINIAESWEIAAHPAGQSIVNNGAHAGKTLTELHGELGLDLIGSRSQWAQDRNKFPLLIKLLDANRELSVQVHPNDAYALEHEGNELGKTEIWYILHAEEGAQVIFGVTEGTTPENFAQAINDGNLEPRLHYVDVKAGDFVYVPAGTLHAILKGICVAEVQQNSNTTYRVYDWNRMGKDGKPRQLHVKQALETINFSQIEPALETPPVVDLGDGVTQATLCSNRYFNLERFTLKAGSTYSGICDGSTFEIWGTTQGTAMASSNGNSAEMPAIRWVLLPAALGEFTISAETDCELLRAYVAD